MAVDVDIAADAVAIAAEAVDIGFWIGEDDDICDTPATSEISGIGAADAVKSFEEAAWPVVQSKRATVVAAAPQAM